jgi:hypothetical protein
MNYDCSLIIPNSGCTEMAPAACPTLSSLPLEKDGKTGLRPVRPLLLLLKPPEFDPKKLFLIYFPFLPEGKDPPFSIIELILSLFSFMLLLTCVLKEGYLYCSKESKISLT